MNDKILIFIIIAAGLAMMIFYGRRKHTIKSALKGMLSGAAALVFVHYLGGYIGFSPPLNIFNTAVSLILGVPGVVLIMGVNLL